jgi:hypothetical protein
VDWPSAAAAVHLLRLTLTDPHGRVLSRNTYWRYREPADLRALNDLAAPKLAVKVRRSGDGLTATVTNTGRTVAAMVRLSLRDRKTGERVLPAVYEDNYLWLLPGESREITVAALHAVSAERLTVTAEGYHA